MIAGEGMRTALRAAASTDLVHDRGTWRTGAELDAAIGALAARLVDRVGLGGSVGIWTWNGAEAIVAHLAAERAGLNRVPVDPASPAPEAQAIYAAAGVGLVLVDDEHALDTVATEQLGPGVWAGGTDVAPVEVDADATASTVVRGMTDHGLFAIPMSFGNWEAHMRLALQLLGSGVYGRQDDRPCFLTVQQFMYGSGLVGTFPFLRAGLPQVVLRTFDAEAVAAAVTTFDATATFMVPGMVTRLAGAVGTPREGWRLHILYGGAPVPVADLRAAMAVLGTNLTQLYGRFEGGWPITVLDAGDHRRIADGDDDLATSCGRVVEGVEVDLRDAAGGQELRVRSGCVSPAFRDPDGWCALGDLVTVDADGYYRLHGRVDGMINTGSFHVYPDEVVAAIRSTFPAVTEAEVVAVPDPRWGQAVCANLRWAPGSQPPPDGEFRNLLATRLAKYKVPTLIRNSTG